ncbi:MAG TPA: cytochrome c [Noviherbaspirillum sp.]
MRTKHLVIALLALCAASTGFAQVKPEDEIRYRQSVMNVIGRAFGPMVGMAQNKIPYNKDVVAKNTQIIETLSGLPWNAFGPGTEKGAPTKADMKVWSDSTKFKGAADKMQQEVSKLSQTVKAGDEKAILAQVGEVGKACKSCHDDFRLKEARN